MRARLAAPLLVLLIAACGGKTGPAQTQVVPSTPKGTVWGQLLDAATQAPLAGVKVSVAVGASAMTATSGSDGSFSVTGVPAGGTVGVTFAKTGYVGTTLPVQVPASAGNFPVDGAGGYVGPVGLFPATGVLHVQVIGYDGSLIDGATATATVPAAYYVRDGGGLRGLATASGQTSGGQVDLKGLPDLGALAEYGGIGLTVSVGAVDTNGDGIPEYLGNAVALDPAAAVKNGGRVTVTLPPPGSNQPLLPLASNVGSIFHSGLPHYKGSVISASDPVRIIFNQPVDPATFTASIVDDTDTSVPIALSVKQGNVVEIAPKTSLSTGGAYWMSAFGQAAGTSGSAYRTALGGWFYIPAADTKPQVASVVLQDLNRDGNLDAGDRITLTFDRAVGLDQGQSGAIAFYISYDLDGSGTVGDAPYEAGSNQPLYLTPDPPPGKPFPGLVRSWSTVLRPVLPVPPASPYQFGPNSTVAYVVDFPGSPGIYDAEGRPLQVDDGQQFTVTFK